MGVERQAVTGERNGADNAPHPLFCFQFKLRRVIPSWLFTWLGGIAATAERAGKVGVLVLKRPHVEDADAVVVLRWQDWVDLHGPVKFGDAAHRRRPDRAEEATGVQCNHPTVLRSGAYVLCGVCGVRLTLKRWLTRVPPIPDAIESRDGAEASSASSALHLRLRG